MTVAELDGALDRIEATTGPGSATARQAVLGELFARATSAEADFVVRLLTGELRQGALAGLMADAIAARRARFPPPRFGGPRCSAATSPMLPAAHSPAAKPRSPRSAWRCCARCSRCSPRARPPSPRRWPRPGRASVEWKLDGARIQVHRAGDEVRVFTRNLNDITARVPEVVEVVRAFAGRTFVLDGEAIGLTEDALPRRFQDTMSRFGTDDATSHTMTLAPFFFDVLHLDGEDLLDRTLAERAAILTELVGEWRVPGDRDRRSRTRPKRSSPTRSPPATKA